MKWLCVLTAFCGAVPALAQPNVESDKPLKQVVLHTDHPTIILFEEPFSCSSSTEWIDIEIGARLASLKLIQPTEEPIEGLEGSLHCWTRSHHWVVPVFADRRTQLHTRLGRLGKAKKTTKVNASFRVATTESSPNQPRRPAGPKKRSISAHLKATGGALWSENSIVPGQRSVAFLKGVGVQIRKNIAPKIAIDGEFQVARASDAGFRDVNWNGLQGDLLQTTTLARLGIGGQLRAGGRLFSTVRASMGIEAAWSQFRFFDGSSMRLGPDDDVEWSVLFSLSVGLDVSIGNRTLVGADLRAAGRRSLEGSLRIGYRP